MRDGGIGLPNTARVAPLAFWANFAQACPQLSRPEHQPLTDSAWAAAALRECFFSAPMRDARADDDTRGPADCSPRAVLDFYHEPAPARRFRAFNAAAGLPKPPAQQLQRALNHAALARERERLLVGHDEKSSLTRRLNACGGAGGTAWLSCPTSEHTTIKDRDYRAAVRLRLGATPVEVPVDTCPVCPRRPSFVLQLHPPTWCLAPTPCTATGPRRSDTRSWATHWFTTSRPPA
jgi:hypothetical protein